MVVSGKNPRWATNILVPCTTEVVVSASPPPPSPPPPPPPSPPPLSPELVKCEELTQGRWYTNVVLTVAGPSGQTVDDCTGWCKEQIETDCGVKVGLLTGMAMRCGYQQGQARHERKAPRNAPMRPLRVAGRIAQPILRPHHALGRDAPRFLGTTWWSRASRAASGRTARAPSTCMLCSRARSCAR